MIRYIVVPKVYPSGWWVTAASADGFTKLPNTIFNPYLARGFGDQGMLVVFLHLSCMLLVPVSMQLLLRTWQAKATWTQGAFSPYFQE